MLLPHSGHWEAGTEHGSALCVPSSLYCHDVAQESTLFGGGR